jgi:hypothetical protein
VFPFQVLLRIISFFARDHHFAAISQLEGSIVMRIVHPTFVCLALLPGTCALHPVDRTASVADSPRVAQAYGRLPMSFEINQARATHESNS